MYSLALIIADAITSSRVVVSKPGTKGLERPLNFLRPAEVNVEALGTACGTENGSREKVFTYLYGPQPQTDESRQFFHLSGDVSHRFLA